MKMKYILSIFMILSIIMQSQAGSIYSKRDQKTAKAIYADDKATQIGDILTVIIVEDSKIDNKIDRDLSKETEHGVALEGKDVNIAGMTGWFPDIGLSGTSSKTLSGKSDYKDERTYEDRISVVVEDIHPNGNLVVIGTRERDIAGDKQTIQVSGIVRPRDISFGNMINSDQVANFKIVTIHKGVTNDYTNPGWVGKIFDALWPF